MLNILLNNNYTIIAKITRLITRFISTRLMRFLHDRLHDYFSRIISENVEIVWLIYIVGLFGILAEFMAEI